MSDRVTFALGPDGVAEVRQVAAGRRNAIDPQWVAELGAAVTRCAGPDVRAVLLCADGPAFSVGADRGHLAGRDLHDELRAMITPYHEALAALGELPVPVVCAAQGAVAGGALGLAWVADVVLLADDAKLVTAFTGLGLVGDGGLTWALPRLVGLRRALQLTMGGRRLTAAEAVEWGLADEVVPLAGLQEAGRERAAALAAGPTVALGHLRRLLRTAHERPWREQLDEELAAQLAAAPHTSLGRLA